MAFPILQEINHTTDNLLIVIGVVLMVFALVFAFIADTRVTTLLGKILANTATVFLAVLATGAVVTALLLIINAGNERDSKYYTEIASYMKHEYGIKVSSDWSAYKLVKGASVDVIDLEGKPLTVRFTELDSKNPKLWESGYKEVERLREQDSAH